MLIQGAVWVRLCIRVFSWGPAAAAGSLLGPPTTATYRTAVGAVDVDAAEAIHLHTAAALLVQGAILRSIQLAQQQGAAPARACSTVGLV